MRSFGLVISVGVFIILGLSSCRNEVGKPLPLMIALSKGSPDSLYTNYYNWIRTADSTIVCKDMYDLPVDSALKIFSQCSGLILTGGTDINPAFYGKAHDTARCWPVDHHRDQIELLLIDSALAWNMPVLGICRGHQMLNVALGGSLVIDIPSDFDTAITHQCNDYLICFHQVSVDTVSLLFEITGQTAGEVNSNHHQAAFEMAPRLKASAFAPDGLIEALEWKDANEGSFLLGVQWHPERMDPQNPFSGKIRESFLKECRKFESR